MKSFDYIYGAITVSLIIAAALFSILGLAVFYSRKRLRWQSQENMPYILRCATLALNERELLDRAGNRVRVDQVFRSWGGNLIVVDSKTRKQHVVYSNDREQVAKYAETLDKVYNQKVASFAYIRTVVHVNNGAGRSVKYIKLKLDR